MLSNTAISIIAGWVPFAMTNESKQSPRVEVRTQRLFEAAVIAAILAAIGYIAIIPRLEERIDFVREDVAEIKGLLRDHVNAPGQHRALEERVKVLEREDALQREQRARKRHEVDPH